jgi:hypothetical protein
MTDISELPREDRAKRYHLLAAFARWKAEAASRDEAEGYLLLAHEWEMMAKSLQPPLPDALA